jgi:hypothetical protein
VFVDINVGMNRSGLPLQDAKQTVPKVLFLHFHKPGHLDAFLSLSYPSRDDAALEQLF